ncbi:MAG: hypothetical protein FWH32_00360 [Clostridiales bacterium]|nr:hypothetical protein [Clostridiales bacterium]
MKKTSEEYSLLCDYYGSLISERQREVFELYYEENLSLAEIAEGLGVSRQAVHIALGKAVVELEAFEKKLGLITRHTAYEKTMNEVEAKFNAILKDRERVAVLDPDLVRDLKRIKRLVKELDI